MNRTASPDRTGPDQAQHADKRVSTLAALLAMRGFALEQHLDGTFSVERWGLVKPLRDINSVEKFLRQIGGGHA